MRERRRMFGPTQGQDERPPRVPVAASRRGREHAIQRNDVNTDGYFVERLFDFPFPEILPGHSAQVNMRVMSMGARYIVLPAIRGVVKFAQRDPPSGLELANLMLRLVLNGQDDWIHDGQGGNSVSFATLFSNPLAPWFWFEHPFRLRAGDNLLATVTNNFEGEGNDLTPGLTLRMMDADIYWDLYGRLLDVEDAEREELDQEVEDEGEELDDHPFFDVLEAD
jgi:hypothetical protein